MHVLRWRDDVLLGHELGSLICGESAMLGKHQLIWRN